MEILQMQSADELTLLDQSDFTRQLSGAEIVRIFELCGAIWTHDGVMTHPHAELTSGLCGNGYVDCRRPLSHTKVCQILASQIWQKIRGIMDPDAIDWVISSAYTAIPLGKNVADMLGCRFGYTEKGSHGKQVWNGGSFREEDVLLQVEDTNVTGSTILAVRKGIRDSGASMIKYAPHIGLIVNRSTEANIAGSHLIPLVNLDQWWQEESPCRLCQAGSPRLRPRVGDNWMRLTQPELYEAKR